MKANRRLLAMVLAVTMVFSMGFTGAFATGSKAVEDSGSLTATATANLTTIQVNGTATVSVAVNYVDSGSNATPITAGYTVAYESSATDKATVDANGTVTGIAAGDTIITAAVTGTDTYEGLSATATVTITVEEVTPPSVDKTTLTTAIAAATTAKGTATVSTDGTDIEPAEQWVTQSAMEAFIAAIAAAQTVWNNTDATTEDVMNAVSALDTAKTVFENAKQAGTKPADPIPGTASIQATIEAMELLVGNDKMVSITKVEHSSASTPPVITMVPATDYTVTYAAPTDTSVATIGNDGKVTGVKVGSTSVKVTVTGKDGTPYAGLTDTKTVNITVLKADVNGLTAGITAAETKLTGVVISKNNGEDILKGTKWVNEAAMKALNDALATAKALIAKGEAALQPAVTLAENALNTAIAGFVPADGKKVTPPTPSECDKTKLEAAIKAATDVQTGVKLSVDGKDVATTEQWTTQTAFDTLKKAITAAEAVAKETSAVQKTVDDAEKALAAATTAFNATLQKGTKAPTPPPVEKPDNGKVTEADKGVAAGGDKAKDEIKNAVADVANDKNATTAQKDAAKAVTEVIAKDAPIADVAKVVTQNFTKLPAAVQEAVKENVLTQVTSTVAEIAKQDNVNKEAMDTKAVADLESLLVAVGVPAAKVTGNIQPAMSGATLSTDASGAQVAVAITEPTTPAATLIPNLPAETTKTKVIELDLTVGGHAAEVKAPITFTFSCVNLGLTSGAKNVKVYHITADGKTVELNSTSVSGGKVTFTVGSFSSIVFAEIPGGTTNNGGGSSGGSKSNLTFGGAFDTKATDASSANVGANGAVNATAAANDASQAVKNALAKKSTSANIMVVNAKSITPDAIKAIADAAKKAGGSVTLNADTTYAGKTIARLYLDPAKAAVLGKEINLSVATDSASIAATKTRFSKYFTNKMAVASFAQQGSFGMTIQAAVRVDLSGLNAKTLHLYSFNRATNQYVALSTQGMFVDANGFLHFNTNLGGDILITDAPLTARK